MVIVDPGADLGWTAVWKIGKRNRAKGKTCKRKVEVRGPVGLKDLILMALWISKGLIYCVCYPCIL